MTQAGHLEPHKTARPPACVTLEALDPLASPETRPPFCGVSPLRSWHWVRPVVPVSLALWGGALCETRRKPSSSD